MRAALLALAGLTAWTMPCMGQVGPATKTAPPLDGARVLHDELQDDAGAKALAHARERAEGLRRLLARQRGQEVSSLEALARADQSLSLASHLREAARLEADAARKDAEAARSKQVRLATRLRAARLRSAWVMGALARESEVATFRRVLGALSRAPEDRDPEGARAAAVVNVRRETQLGQELADLVSAARESERAAENTLSLALRAEERERDSVATLRREQLARTRELSRLRRQRAEVLSELAQAESALQEMLAGLPGRRRAPQGENLAETQIFDLRPLRGQLPWPVSPSAPVELTGRFGELTHPRHGTKTVRNGILLRASAGQPILAMAPGRVIYSDWYKGFGRALVLSHGHGILSVHAHAESFLPALGEWVQAGEKIGFVGETGSLDGPQLYFQIQKDGVPSDPLTWLSPVR